MGIFVNSLNNFMKKPILIIISIVLICGCVLLGVVGCSDKTNEDVKKYIESIGYQCDAEYKCSLVDKDGNLNTFEIPKETGFNELIKYVKKWENGSYFLVRLGSYTQGSYATYKEKYNNIRLEFSDLKNGKELTCGFYQELYQGKDELKICEDDIGLINEAKLYFEEIMEKSGVKLKK